MSRGRRAAAPAARAPTFSFDVHLAPWRFVESTPSGEGRMTEIQKYLAEEVALTFTQADHAFFNDTGARFNAKAAEEAWRRVVGWFDDSDEEHR
jgi:dienelactone hydrolase